MINRPVVRDGKPYPPPALEELELLPGVRDALVQLRQRGFRLCVVTNQPDVARGRQRRAVVEAMHAALRAALPLDGVYVCYHDDADACDCRKPKPGLLLAAAAEQHVSLPASYLIGDRWRDIDCGHAAGCTTIWIDRGYREALRMPPHFRAPDLASAATIILSAEEHTT